MPAQFVMGGDDIIPDPTMARHKNPPLSTISIGPYVRLYSEQHFLQELAPLGLTLDSLRRFFRALSVPTLHLAGTRYIDAFSLSLALRAVLRIGEPDFLAPGCAASAKGRKPPRTTRTLNPARLKGDLEPLIFELLAAHKTRAWDIPSTEIADAARDAARRLIHAGFISLPHDVQREYTRQALEAVRTDPIDPRTPPLMGGDA
jgi:hypothetical protein